MHAVRRPATTRKGKQFSWHHPALYFTLLAGVLIYVIVALILTKRRWLSAPFCEQHKNHWLWRTAAALGGLALVAAVGAAAFMLVTSADQGGSDELGGGICLGSIALLLGWLVAVVVIQLGAIRATEITDRSITLTNVAQGFLIAYEEEAERDYRPRIDDIVRDHWRARKANCRATPTRTYAGRARPAADGRIRTGVTKRLLAERGNHMADVRLDFYDLDADALPDVCMKCGAAAAARPVKQFSWMPYWARFVPPIIGVWFVKRRRVPVPLCEQHKNHWTIRYLVGIGGLLCVLGLLILGGVLFASNVDDDPGGPLTLLGGAFLGIGGILFIAWLIALIALAATQIGVAEITDDTILLKNVHDDFTLRVPRAIAGRYRAGSGRGHPRPVGAASRPETDGARLPARRQV